MDIASKRHRLAAIALEAAKTQKLITQVFEQHLVAEYTSGRISIDQALAELEAKANEDLRRIKAARLRWARRGEPFQEG